MRVARHHDVHWRREELLELSRGPKAAPQTMNHAEAPAIYCHDMYVLAAGVDDGIVIANGTNHGGEAFKPIQDQRRGQITAVKDEVHRGEKPGGLGAQFVEL